MTTIVTKNGSGAPLASDLVQGELAVDLTNKRLYTENASGTVIEIGTSPSTIDINAGTIDGTVIGGSSAAAGTFTTFTSTGIDDNATSTAITIDSSENVLVGGTSQSGTANKVMVKSADKFGLSIIDTTAQATGVGGALNLGGNYRTSGDAQAFTRIAALKDNSTDSNFAYSMGFYTTPNGGTFTERMRINSSGDVGIGTSSPSSTLHLYGTGSPIRLNIEATTGRVESRLDNTSGAFIFGIDDSSGAGFGSAYSRNIYSNGAYPMLFWTNNTERMRIDSSGNVGIGTSSNIAGINLEIKKAGAYLGLNSTTAGYSLVRGYDNGTERWSIGQIGFGGADGMAFYTGSSNTERMRIDSSGDVLIGTTSSYLSAANRTVVHTEGGTDGALLALTTSTGDFYIASGASGSTNTSLVTRSNGYMNFYTNNTERMRIDSSGNVGFGNTSPAARIDIQIPSYASSTTDGMIKFNDSNGSHHCNIQSFYVGGQGSDLFLGSNSYVDLAGGIDRWTSSYGAANINLSRSGQVTFGTNSSAGVATERMRLTSDGYLLLGTTSITVNETNFGTRIDAGAGDPLKSFRNVGAGSIIAGLGGNAGRVDIKGDGDLENTNNSYGGFSDERLKSNIVDASSQLDDIMAVQVRSYTLNSTGATHIGVVAQELEASGMSGLVKTDDEGMKSVKYSILYMKAIKALQEAVTRIETLEAEVAALKGA